MDHGYSGGTDKRPGLTPLMMLVRSRQVDIVVVAKMDRWFRSLKHLITVFDELQALGVMFISLGDQIDMSTASGRLMLQIVGAFSELERALVSERTMAGLAFARSQGKRLGRPKTRDDMAILRLRAEGRTYSEIQQKLNISRPSIRRAILGTLNKDEKPRF